MAYVQHDPNKALRLKEKKSLEVPGQLEEVLMRYTVERSKPPYETVVITPVSRR